MAIGAPLQLGTASAASGSASLALTTGADAPAGGLIIVASTASNTNGPMSVTDSAGNAYAAAAVVNNGTGKSRLFWSFNALDLPSGATITVTFAGTTPTKNIAAVSVSGCAAPDIKGNGATGSSTAPTMSTGALGWTSEIVLGMTHVSAGAGDSFTEAGGFASNSASLNADALRWAYQIVASNAGVTYAPTLGTSRTWGVNTLTFSGAVASPFNRSSRFGYLEM